MLLGLIFYIVYLDLNLLFIYLLFICCLFVLFYLFPIYFYIEISLIARKIPR